MRLTDNNTVQSVGGRKDEGEMRLSILLVVLMLFFSFSSFFYGDAEAQDESADDGGGGFTLLIILAGLGILTYFLVLLKSSTSITAS